MVQLDPVVNDSASTAECHADGSSTPCFGPPTADETASGVEACDERPTGEYPVTHSANDQGGPALTPESRSAPLYVPLSPAEHQDMARQHREDDASARDELMLRLAQVIDQKILHWFRPNERWGREWRRAFKSFWQRLFFDLEVLCHLADHRDGGWVTKTEVGWPLIVPNAIEAIHPLRFRDIALWAFLPLGRADGRRRFIAAKYSQPNKGSHDESDTDRGNESDPLNEGQVVTCPIDCDKDTQTVSPVDQKMEPLAVWLTEDAIVFMRFIRRYDPSGGRALDLLWKARNKDRVFLAERSSQRHERWLEILRHAEMRRERRLASAQVSSPEK